MTADQWSEIMRDHRLTDRLPRSAINAAYRRAVELASILYVVEDPGATAMEAAEEFARETGDRKVAWVDQLGGVFEFVGGVRRYRVRAGARCWEIVGA